MSDSDPSLYNLRYNLSTSNLEAFGGGTPQWTLVTLNNVDPQQVPITRIIATTAPLQGGGNLSADRILSITKAATLSDGYLSSVDWNTFNNKQAAGNYITALTGDGTASGPGSVPLTLATVNGSVGTFSLASITVNAKGLITSASSGTTGSLTDVGTDGITITNGTGAVIGTGTSISQHVADTTHNGYLLSTDWNTFNGKQAAGNYITALTGDVTASGPGSAAATLATVNANVGSFANATVTVNAKGLVTAASVGSAITALTGDATATGPGSAAITFATVNANVGSFTSANITVNAKGLITAASNGSGGVSSVSGTTNQITSTGGSTPVLAIANPLTLPGPMTAGGAIAMGANKITGLANGTAATDAAAFGQIFEGFQAPVQVTDTTNTNTTSSTFTNTATAASITPTSSSHRIKITVSGTFYNNAASTTNAQATIKRGSTNLGGTNGFATLHSSVAQMLNVPISIVFIDSPATTSSTTYTVAIRSSDNSSDVEWNVLANTAVIVLEEIV